MDRNLIPFLRFAWKYVEVGNAEVDGENGVVEQDKYSILPAHTISETEKNQITSSWRLSGSAERKKMTRKSIKVFSGGKWWVFFSLNPKLL